MVGSMMGMSETFKGTWALDGKGYLCRTFVGGTPPNTANPALRADRRRTPLGDTWTMDANGATRTITLKPGIQ